MKLYFQNSNGKERMVAEVENQEDAMSEIKKFCYERDFRIPYVRCWGDLNKDGITYDVGSWSENFVLRKGQVVMLNELLYSRPPFWT